MPVPPPPVGPQTQDFDPFHDLSQAAEIVFETATGDQEFPPQTQPPFPSEQPSYPQVGESLPSMIPTPPEQTSISDTPDDEDTEADPNVNSPSSLGIPTGQTFYQTRTGQQGSAPPIGVNVPYFQGTGYLSTFLNMKEYAGSGKVSYSRNGWKGVRVFEVPWWNWMDFANALLGYSVNNPSGQATYYLPDVFSAGMPWLFCRELDMEGIEGLIRGVDSDPLTPRIKYERARITASYLPLDMDVSLNVSGQIVQLPAISYAWMGTDIRKGLNDVYPLHLYTTLAEDVGKIIPGGEFSLVKHYVPAPYFAQIMQMVGAVNSVNFLGFQPSTLLIMGVEARRTWTLNGSPVWDITVKFNWQPNSWQALYNSKPDGQNGITVPGYQFIRSTATPNSYSTTPAAPPLLWLDGSQIGPVANQVGIGVQDLGFIYPWADPTPLLYFV